MPQPNGATPTGSAAQEAVLSSGGGARSPANGRPSLCPRLLLCVAFSRKQDAAVTEGSTSVARGHGFCPGFQAADGTP